MNNAQKHALPTICTLDDACCGCGACSATCPKRCIELDADAAGFKYPVVDIDTCVRCGRCDSVCPALNREKRVDPLRAFWAKSKNEDELKRSSSGGVFALLARAVLADGGVVAGAAWGEGCRTLRHIVIDDVANLDSIMRSKYVQSSVESDVYEALHEALRSSKPALFVGTACQVAGMRRFLGDLAMSDLFLSVDVICHGAPSPALWHRWLDFCERNEEMEISDVNFRSKITGWSSFSVLYRYKTEKEDTSNFSANLFTEDWYMRAFLSNASLRPACFQCPAKLSCGSDATLGDFWGIQSAHPEVSAEDGVSVVLANTSKGIAALEFIMPHLDYGESSLEKVLPGNSPLEQPVTPFKERDVFIAAVVEGTSVSEMMSRYDFKPRFVERVRGKLGSVKRAMKEKLVGQP